MSKEELVIALRKQRDLESKAVESLSFLAESSKNDVVKLLLLGIMQDSKKHARLVEALIHITEARGVGYVEDEELINGVDEYMKIEEEMAKTVDEIMKMTDRKEVKSILGQVALEEQRHRQTPRLDHLNPRETSCEKERFGRNYNLGTVTPGLQNCIGQATIS